jgi:hypothetical protein
MSAKKTLSTLLTEAQTKYWYAELLTNDDALLLSVLKLVELSP